MKSKDLEEPYSARLGIWTAIFYLVERDQRVDVPPILLLALCVAVASLLPLLPQIARTLATYALRLASYVFGARARDLTRIRPKIWVFPEKYPFCGSNPD